MIVSAIAAVAENNVIGKDNDLVWSLPDDMRFFMDSTKSHHIVTGRRNYESIPEKYRPLKNRVNIVVTRSTSYDAPGAIVVNDIKDAIQLAEGAGEEECFIIGGGQIYKLALELDLLDKMYLTHIHDSFEGDTFYPEFDASNWDVKVLAEHAVDEKHAHPFTIKEYTRKR